MTSSLIVLLSLVAAPPVIDEARLVEWVEKLQSYESRVAGTPGAFAAGDAIAAELTELGLEVERRAFAVANAYDGGRPVVSENLSVSIGPSGAATWVVIAHLDSRGARDPDDARARGWRWDRDPAPGADDDASGCAVLLELARSLRDRALSRRITLVFSGAEEMALIASDGFMENLGAEHVALDGVEGAIAVDMVLRSRPWGNALRVYTDGRWVSSGIAQAILHASWIAAPEVMIDVRHDPSFTFSDHGSFWAAGIGAVLLIEDDFHHSRYHTPSDRFDRGDAFYQPAQMAKAARILLEALLFLAG
jgi:Zn-dependent M28 family amino/carboxypeptidase